MNPRIAARMLACMFAVALTPVTSSADTPPAESPTGVAAPAAAPASAASPAAASPAAANATAAIGSPAPDFTLTDTDGKSVTLSDLRGKIVVLEWFNADCPFIVHAHGEKGVLRGMSEAWADENVTWLAINSSAEGKQGHGRDRNAKARIDFAMKFPVLLDPTGKAGMAYGAKTTPHVYVIDAKGMLVYKGGVDNAPMGEAPDGASVEPWLKTALEEVTAGKPVTRAETRSYGCSVKYASR